MKKSLENYNNIRLTKRVKSNEDNTSINATILSPKKDASSILESNTTLNRKIIFKSKASSTAPSTQQTKKQQVNSQETVHKQQANGKSRIKLKRSISDDDDKDEDEIKLANDPEEAKVKQLLASCSVKIKLKCSDSDSEKEELKLEKIKSESPSNSNTVNTKHRAKNISPPKYSQKTICTRSSPNKTIILTSEYQKSQPESPPSASTVQSAKSSPKKLSPPKVKSPTKQKYSPSNTKQPSPASSPKKSFTNLIEQQQQSAKQLSLNHKPLVKHNLLSSDSDTDDENAIEDDELNPLDRNIKITSHKKKFIKLIKTSSSSMNSVISNGADSSKSLTTLTKSSSNCSTSFPTSSSSQTNLTKENNCLSKRKIFSSKRHDSTSFKLNFTNTSSLASQNDLTSNGNGANSLSTSSSRSSSLNSLNQEKNINVVKILFNSDHTSNSSNTEGEEEDDEMGTGCLRNTRKAYECENLGEAQAFQDDLFYLMDGLKSRYKLSERCLCAIKLAEQCLSSEFRMSLRSSSSVDYVNKIFKILNDSNKFKSLALCTSLIMFALTQDKLKISVDKPTFYLMISILNMTSKNGECSFSSMFLNDPASLLASPPSSSSMRSSKSTSPSQLCLMNLNVNNETLYTKNACDIDYDENDEIVYKRIYDRCKIVFNQLISMRDEDEAELKVNNSKNDEQVNGCENDLEDNEYKNSLDLTLTPKNSKVAPLISNSKDLTTFNSQILALECILNFNFNKQNESLSVDWFKNEMRELFVLEKLLILLKFLVNQYRKEKGKCSNTGHCILNKYAKYINLIITVTQHPMALNSPNKLSLSQGESDVTSDQAESASALNQSYLINYQNNFLQELLNESLCLFYGELESLSKISFNNNKSMAHMNQEVLKNALSNSIKQTFLVMINLTHKNSKSSSKLASDKSLIDLVFKCIGSTAYYFDDNEQFDILIMSLVILLNIFDTNFKQETSLCLIKHIKALNKNSFDVILNLYKKKEQLVHLAENDQEKELKELNTQIESQNVESINSTFMNSIGKAGKHMEDHIIAAHSALVIGYMILTDQHFNKNPQDTTKKSVRSLINLEKHKLDMKENSFKHMAQIIRKFLVFMTIMKCSGFSDDEHIQLILKQLEEI